MYEMHGKDLLGARVTVEHAKVRCKTDNQCCESGMFIPDPNVFRPGSTSKNLSILTPKMVSKL